MSALLKDFVFTNIIFWVCLTSMIILLLLGFFMPPVGVIDNSILKGCGEIMGMATLGVFFYCFKEGVSARFTKGDMSVEVTKENSINN